MFDGGRSTELLLQRYYHLASLQVVFTILYLTLFQVKHVACATTANFSFFLLFLFFFLIAMTIAPHNSCSPNNPRRLLKIEFNLTMAQLDRDQDHLLCSGQGLAVLSRLQIILRNPAAVLSMWNDTQCISCSWKYKSQTEPRAAF